jgi:hypothetical protein
MNNKPFNKSTNKEPYAQIGNTRISLRNKRIRTTIAIPEGIAHIVLLKNIIYSILLKIK